MNAMNLTTRLHLRLTCYQCLCVLGTIIVEMTYGCISVWAVLQVHGVSLITLRTTHCFGGNSLNYSPALIGSLNGDWTGFLPTVMFDEGSLSSLQKWTLFLITSYLTATRSPGHVLFNRDNEVLTMLM